jgi:hypothetical protein
MQSEVAVSPYVKILFPNTILKVLPVVLRSILFIITIVTFTHAYLVSLVSLKCSTVLSSFTTWN